jgi:hypothetical protein
MPSETINSGGSPDPTTRQDQVKGTAKGIDSVYREKANRVPGDLLARTIACQPPNEARIRGIVV